MQGPKIVSRVLGRKAAAVAAVLPCELSNRVSETTTSKCCFVMTPVRTLGDEIPRRLAALR